LQREGLFDFFLQRRSDAEFERPLIEEVRLPQ
jgi:hypothetical protein